MRTGVREAVAVGRSAAEETPFGGGLGGHGGADPDFDAVPFAFAHPAVQRHDEVVGVAAGVDGAANFGHPQGDAVMFEQREGQAELVAVEGALRFTDHHGVEAAVRVA